MPVFKITYFERIHRSVQAESIAIAGQLAQQYVCSLNAANVDPNEPIYKLHSVIQLDHKPSTLPADQPTKD